MSHRRNHRQWNFRENKKMSFCLGIRPEYLPCNKCLKHAELTCSDLTMQEKFEIKISCASIRKYNFAQCSLLRVYSKRWIQMKKQNETVYNLVLTHFLLVLLIYSKFSFFIIKKFTKSAILVHCVWICRISSPKNEFAGLAHLKMNLSD